jgi:hypothetical protein
LSKEEKIRPTQEQYSHELLCHECEQLLSKSYEDYSIGALQGRKKVALSGRYLNKIDVPTIELFLLSIIWKAAVSTNDAFNEVTIGSDTLEKMRQALINGKPDKTIPFSFKVTKLTLEADDGIGNEELAGFQMKISRTTHNGKTAFKFLLLGFLIACISPKASSAQKRKEDGFLTASQSRIKCDEMHVLDVPEILALLKTAAKKDREGLTLIKNRPKKQV